MAFGLVLVLMWCFKRIIQFLLMQLVNGSGFKFEDFEEIFSHADATTENSLEVDLENTGAILLLSVSHSFTLLKVVT